MADGLIAADFVARYTICEAAIVEMRQQIQAQNARIDEIQDEQVAMQVKSPVKSTNKNFC